jgi:hypothetical protein
MKELLGTRYNEYRHTYASLGWILHFTTAIGTDTTNRKQLGSIHQQVVHFSRGNLNLPVVLSPHCVGISLELSNSVETIRRFRNGSQGPVK